MITSKSKIWQYFSNLFVSIDQFGNAFAGGNPDNTISARVGYYNHYHLEYLNNNVPWYWRWFEKIIDTTFYPVDGKGHCHEAYHNDAGEIFDNRVTNIFIALAAVIIILSCFAIAFILYLLYALRVVKPKRINRERNLLKRFEKTKGAITSMNREIVEYGLDFDLSEVQKQFLDFKMKVESIDRLINPK